MKPRWNSEDLFDDDLHDCLPSKRPSLVTIVSKLAAGVVVWTSLAFIIGCILAGFCLGIYFVIDAYLSELLK